MLIFPCISPSSNHSCIFPLTSHWMLNAVELSCQVREEGTEQKFHLSSRLRLFVAKSTTSSLYSPNSPWQCTSPPYITILNDLIYLVYHGRMFQGRIVSPAQGESVSDNGNKTRETNDHGLRPSLPSRPCRSQKEGEQCSQKG